MSTTTSPHADRSLLAPRLRRLQLALADLGIARVVGDGWVVVGGSGFEFGAVDDLTADRLVRLLEDLARVHGAACGVPRAGEQVVDAVAAPVVPPRGTSSVHLVVPR